jgi:hypothetical protein
MSYRWTEHTLPDFEETWSALASGDYVGSWQALAADITIPTAAPWFAIVDGMPSAFDMTKANGQDLYVAYLFLQLADEDGSVKITQAVADVGGNNTLVGNANQYLAQDKTWSGKALTQARLLANIWRGYHLANLTTLYAAMSGAKLRVYYTSSVKLAIPVYAKKVDALPQIVEGGAAGKRITRIRYRIDQASVPIEGEINWTATAEGDKVYQLPTE